MEVGRKTRRRQDATNRQEHPMRITSSIFSLLSLALITAAPSSAHAGTNLLDLTFGGEVCFEDEEYDYNGFESTCSAPGVDVEVDSVHLEIDVEGAGLLGLDNILCGLLGRTSQMEADLTFDLSLDDSGLYSVVAADGVVDAVSSLGCLLSTVSLTSLTTVTARAEIDADAEVCAAFCDAQGRAYAETECDGHPAEARCRAELEVAAAATCEDVCLDVGASICAEAEVSATVLSGLGSSLSSGLGADLDLDLTFDCLQDSSGAEIEPIDEDDIEQSDEPPPVIFRR
jgi:hypothetical protein